MRTTENLTPAMAYEGISPLRAYDMGYCDGSILDTPKHLRNRQLRACYELGYEAALEARNPSRWSMAMTLGSLRAEGVAA